MKDKTIRGIIIGTGLVLSAVLVFMIAERMKPVPVVDEPLPTTTPSKTEVVVDDIDKNEITVPEIELNETTDEKAGDEIDQTIQPDPEPKPTITEEQKTDSTQTPSGDKVEPPTVDNPNPTQTVKPTQKPQPPVNQGGGLPGFDNVPDLGENHHEHLDDMYENGNKVGIMD